MVSKHRAAVILLRQRICKLIAGYTGHPERLFDELAPQAHGGQVASTGGSGAAGGDEHTTQTGHPDRLLPATEPHGHGLHVS